MFVARSRHADVLLDSGVPVAEHAGLDLVAVLVDQFEDHALAGDVVLLALSANLDQCDGVVEFLLVDLAVVAGLDLDELLDGLEGNAFEDVAIGLADLGQRGAGRVNGDALLEGNLENLALLILVDVAVIIGAKLDLLDELPFHFIQGHHSLLPRMGARLVLGWDGSHVHLAPANPGSCDVGTFVLGLDYVSVAGAFPHEGVHNRHRLLRCLTPRISFFVGL